MITRRTFLKVSSAGALTLYALNEFGVEEAIAAIPGGTLLPGAIPKFVTPLVKPPAMPHIGAQPIQHRRPAVHTANPPGSPADDDGVELRLDDERGDIQLSRLHDRGDARHADHRDVDQRPQERKRRLPAPPAAGRSHTALGKPAERDESCGERRRDARLAPDLCYDTGPVHGSGPDRHARPRHGARRRLERRLRGGLVSPCRRKHPGGLRHGGDLVQLLQGQGCVGRRPGLARGAGYLRLPK